MNNQRAQSATTELKTTTVSIIVVFFGLIWAIFLPSCSGTPEKFVPTDLNASVMSHQFVTDRLKSPSTAEFSSQNQEIIIQKDDSTWVVTGHVDSQNGFGAMIRSSFICEITYRGEIAVCKDIQIF